MTPKKFEQFFEYVIARAKVSLTTKSSEYAIASDKLYNFKRAGEILRKTPEEALWGMYVKHLTSLQDIVENIGKGEYPSLELLEEKTKDAINYTILLEAVIRESLEKDKDE